MFQIKFVQKIKTHILYATTFSEEHAFYEILWKNMVESYRRIHFACRMCKDTETIRICNTYCFFTATIVTRTHLIITCISTSLLVVYNSSKSSNATFFTVKIQLIDC